MKRFLLILILFICSFVFGQNSKTDSLLNLIKTDKEDTNKVNNLNELSDIYWRKGSYDTAVVFANNALKLGQTLPFGKNIGWTKGQATSYNHLGSINRLQGFYSKALDYYLKALKINEELKDKKRIAVVLGNIGGVYYNQSDYPKALTYYFKALQMAEELENKKGIAADLGNIGLVYSDQADYPKALEYYFKALKISEVLGNKNNMAAILVNIGIAYQNQVNYPEALTFYFKALKMDEELGYKQLQANTLGNIGLVYTQEADYPKALDCYFKALKMSEEMGDKNEIARNLSNIGSLYVEIKKYREAETYLPDALKLYNEIGAKDGERQTEEILSTLYERTGKDRLALQHYKKAMQLKDTLFNAENKKQLVKKEMNFEFEKKEAVANAVHKKELENQEAIANEKSRKQNIITWSVIGGLLLVLAFSGFVFRSLRVTRKQKQIIEIKNKETELQKHIIEEKHKEITDSINYAERIQRSFMATKEILDTNLKDYFVFFQPKDVVSGDFYWASQLNNGNFALVTADSTGHGVPGAIMSLLNITSLEKAIETCTQPSDILNATRKNIIERLKKDGSAEGGKDGMDASVIVFDSKNNQLIISAAYNPVWIVRGAETIEIKPDKMPIGKHDKQSISFTQQEIILQTGDVIYTLTDGFPDQFGGEKGKKFMSKNLRELLVENAHLPMQEQKKLLDLTLKNWVGNLEQIDDITLIGIRV